eukprot:c16766_g1_i1 orf=46-207(-)
MVLKLLGNLQASGRVRPKYRLQSNPILKQYLLKCDSHGKVILNAIFIEGSFQM